MRIECVLRHDGKEWVATGSGLEARGRTLEELDATLAKRLHNKADDGSGEIKVFMAFDNSQIPQWIRQYAQHYFNREITVAG